MLRLVKGNWTEMVDRRWRPRLFAEAAVIVFSILLALVLEAAWEERSERVQEAELITRLAAVLPHILDPSRWAPPPRGVNGMSERYQQGPGP